MEIKILLRVKQLAVKKNVKMILHRKYKRLPFASRVK